MKVLRDIQHLPPLNRPLVTIGTFDGVHLGHKQVLSQLVQEARKNGVDSLLITFDPHPRQALGLGEIALLSLLEEKLNLLSETGLDYVLVIPFTLAFSQKSAIEFIHEYLLESLTISGIFLGYDHKFGNKREGSVVLLKRELEPMGIQVREIPAHAVDSITISSTKIRNFLIQGNAAEANQLLGYAYSFSGKVGHGEKRGRTLGFPTANIEIEDPSKLLPGRGVYAVRCGIGKSAHFGMMNIGQRPTVGGMHQTIEVYVLNFNRDIYGEIVEITVLEKIRDERSFSSLEALKEQLTRDEALVRTYCIDG